MIADVGVWLCSEVCECGIIKDNSSNEISVVR